MDDAAKRVEQSLDQSDIPEDPAAVDQTPAERQAEAARIGAEDQSHQAGAAVPDQDHMAAGGSVVAGDPDALSEQAKVVGEEAVGGTTPTPDQDVVDDIGDAVGVSMAPDRPVDVTEEMHARDEQRWELDPQSKGRPSETGPLENQR